MDKKRLIAARVFGGGVVVAVTYPLDEYSADLLAVYSLRRLLSSYSGSFIRVRRDSDDAEMDFGGDSNGDLDVAAITAWLSGANPYQVTIYDQSGNNLHQTQADTTRQPLLNLTGINSKPAFTMDGAGDYLGYGATVNGGSAGAVFVSLRTPAAIAASRILTSCDEATTNYYFLLSIVAAKKLAIEQRSNDTADVVIGDTVLSNSTDYVLSYLSTGGEYGLRVNGADETLSVLGGLNSGDWFNDTANRDNMIYGAQKTTSVTTTAKLTFRDMVVYAANKSGGVITAVENILSTDIGLSLSIIAPVIGLLSITYSSSIGL